MRGQNCKTRALSYRETALWTLQEEPSLTKSWAHPDPEFQGSSGNRRERVLPPFLSVQSSSSIPASTWMQERDDSKQDLSLPVCVCVHVHMFFVCGLLKFKETKTSHFIYFCGMAPGQKPSCTGMLSRALVGKLYSHPVLLFVYVSLFGWFGFCFLDRVYVAQLAFQLRFSCFSTPSTETMPSKPTWRRAYHENVYIASVVQWNRRHPSWSTVRGWN